MEICIDFDGTCVTHEYPRLGEDIGAVPVLIELNAAGHNLILFTMRSGKELQDAIDWFNTNNIPLYGIQTNPTQKEWTDSPKAYGQLYIDDAALGCPLIHSADNRPYVDWNTVRDYLFGRGILS